MTTLDAAKKEKKEVLQLTLKVRVWDRSGRVIQEYATPSRSPVRAFLECILGLVAQATVNTVDIGGAADTTAQGPSVLNAEGLVTETLKGIVIGTGVTAVDITDYALAAQIAHGTGAGQLSYGAQTNSQVTTTASEASFDLTRSFTNGGTASITVRECGIHANNGAVSDTLLIVRDVITPIVVPVGGGCTIEYTLKISE